MVFDDVAPWDQTGGRPARTGYAPVYLCSVPTEKWPWSEHHEVSGDTRPGKEPVSVVCCPWLVAQRDGL